MSLHFTASYKWPEVKCNVYTNIELNLNPILTKIHTKFELMKGYVFMNKK
jgi:hypothetical protein